MCKISVKITTNNQLIKITTLYLYTQIQTPTNIHIFSHVISVSEKAKNVSQILFSLFLNDIEKHHIQQTNIGNNLNNYIEHAHELVLILFYADDTILIAEDQGSLQKCLNDFTGYCHKWKLHVNIDKTKVVVFGSRTQNNDLTLQGRHLAVVNTYKYLGTVFTKSGSFTTCINLNIYQNKQIKPYIYFIIE